MHQELIGNMATRLRFQKAKFHKELMKQKHEIDKLQTSKFVDFAEEETTKIAQLLVDWEDTGNLLDSLCWGVWHNKKLVRRGYYRKQPMAQLDSYLHELSPDRTISINGRFLADQFLAQYNPTIESGWEVVWGILAPYWAYWEGGHFNVLIGDSVQFFAMSQRYDHIKDVFEPTSNGYIKCTVDFAINKPE